ncbi:MAG: F0F1 ATP synthase subunit A [Candidatus Marinimicrobia bacterium]|jgi:F-type H+-transporting ATPase subunit a|nr:F0F1 ATP synthase subunit A [Candidatus Neomarinimicrobiota bacterium]MDP7483147.1 F0F1 ATP synthase subunit A [Candidatus Neomarinimicrobiota bacterium]MDP7528408.1 F0F1 ATP synthase subunit A [Candidatus Neomarinimicrobiota bacterium]MDP7715691.1 F0F1 ATP synthase subunit A [Candidatus Neomarinimicrobiota bacterium]HJL74693.1 F0F1 ATP synthase subunit A [Candidatus Neomarinimicrobiota bacterium]|tara:strand:- start:797 stop:1729 length:933 start_codon:yes stop_codon:yes gene_type:complete
MTTVAGSENTSGSVMDQVGDYIIHHISNSDIHHPIIHFPTIFGIDFSITKHVLMLWITAAIVATGVILPIRAYLKKKESVPTGMANALEAVVSFIKDSVVKPNVGPKWVDTWAPLILSYFFFILVANALGLIPIFDTIGVVARFVFGVGPHNDHAFVNNLLHGGSTATGNFVVTAALASITFIAIIIAGTRAHGFIAHWKNLVPHGLALPVYLILIPIEIIGLFVKPFALTMRLAANMTGGHIAILAILSFIAIFAEVFHTTAAGLGIAAFSVPIASALTGLEIIVTLVQAYVFSLLSAVFIGMAINVHH